MVIQYDKMSHCGCTCSSCKCNSTIQEWFQDLDQHVAEADSCSNSTTEKECDCSCAGASCTADCFSKNTKQSQNFQIAISLAPTSNFVKNVLLPKFENWPGMRQCYLSNESSPQMTVLNCRGNTSSASLGEVMRFISEHKKKNPFSILFARLFFVRDAKFTKGVKCQGCVDTIEEFIKEEFSGLVDSVHFLNEQEKIIGFWSQEPLSDEQFQEIIEGLKEIGKMGQIVQNNAEEQDLFTTIYFSIPNMKCKSCVAKISEVLSSQGEEIKQYSVDLPSKSVSIQLKTTDHRETVVNTIKSLLEGLRFQVVVQEPVAHSIEYSFKIPKIKCKSCAGKITTALYEAFPDCTVEVDIANKTVFVTSSHTRDQVSQVLRQICFPEESVIVPVEETSINEEKQIEKKMQITEYADVELEEMDEKPSTKLIIEPQVVVQTMSSKLERLDVSIIGMTCASCVSKIENYIEKQPGVQSCKINLMAQRGTIQYEPQVISPSDVVKMIISLGYESKEIEKESSEEGRVVFRIESIKDDKSFQELKTLLLSEFDAITNIVSDAHEKCKITIDFDEEQLIPRNMIQLLQQHSYNAAVYVADNSEQRANILRQKEILFYKRMFILSALFTIPLMIVTMILAMIPGPLMEFFHYQLVQGLSVETLVAFIFATPVQFICGYKFYVLAWMALRNFSADMNVLIAIATIEAYGFSIFSVIYGMINPHYHPYQYFETSASLIMFLLLGRWIENIAKSKTSQALVALMDLKPSTALLMDFPSMEERRNFEQKLVTNQLHSLEELNLQEVQVPIDHVYKNDIVKVLSGNKIPVDGVILNGTADIDESMITGESLLQTKTVNDEVIGGTINKDGYIIVKATRVGSKSTLSTIQKLIEDAQTQKPKIQGLADKISGIFVPVVIGLSALTLVVWLVLGLFDLYPSYWRPMNMDSITFAILFSTSVVIIACPCALGLAVPTALMVGTGVAAKLGILIKGGSALESASKADSIIFDKTGTLTNGQLKVNKIYQNNVTHQVYKWVYSVESNSEHPIAKSVVDHLREDFNIIEPEQPKELITKAGKGLKSTFYFEKEDRDVVVHVGNESFLIEEKVIMDSIGSFGIENDVPQTLVYVAVDYKLQMVIGLSDTIKDESLKVVSYLQQKLKLDVYMLTGDNSKVAHHVATQLGIKSDHVFASCTPEQKSEKVKELQLFKHKVIMVGDGINDSISLAQADVGIAIGSTGSQIASETADIVLMNPSIATIIYSISLSKTTYWRIILNFVWAFGYNALFIPLAAGLFYPIYQFIIPPWVASICMVTSSLSVLASSLTLRLYRPPTKAIQAM